MNNGQITLESMSQAVWYNKWIINKISKFLKGDILEAGCGIGNFTNELSKFGDVWAIDIDKSYVNEAQKKVLNVKVGLGDIEKGKFFFKHKTFDSIFCINVLEHIKDDSKALKNLNNILKKDGTLILLVPAHNFLFGSIDTSIGHFRRYNKKDLIGLLEKNNFKVTHLRNLNFLGGIGWFITGKIFKKNTVNKDHLKIFNFLAPIFLFFEDMIEPLFGTSVLLTAQKNVSR